MTRKNPHAVALGKRTSPHKAQSSAENGRLYGGRPKVLCVCGHATKAHRWYEPRRCTLCACQSFSPPLPLS